MSQIKDILSKYKTIAMVGVSNDQTKPSTIVMKYMQKYGYRVYPVNPSAAGQKILGEEVYAKITDIKENVDYIVNLRQSEVMNIPSSIIKIDVNGKIQKIR